MKGGMKVEQETMYAAALQSLRGCGSRRLQALLDVCRSPSQAWDAVWDEDLRRRTGIPAKVFSQLRQERDVFDWDTFQRRLSFYGVRPVALWDDDYPSWLPFIAQPPLVLFCQGTMERDSSSIAIVGSRKASPYGLNAAETLAAELAAQGLTIVSGGARGIDTRAHRGALKGKGRTVVVAANGLDRTYPRENKALFRQVVDSGGAVISEYAFGVEPLSRNFPARNRIIAGMAAATIVVEAALRSGSLITADLALDEGRDVFAMPGSVFSETSRGTNHLLRLGAIPLTCTDDVVREFRRRGWQGPETACHEEGPSLSPAEQAVIDAIPFDRTAPVSELLEKTGLAVADLLPILLALQMKKAAEELPGGYIRCAAAFSAL